MGWLEESWHTWTPTPPDYTLWYVLIVLILILASFVLLWEYLHKKGKKNV